MPTENSYSVPPRSASNYSYVEKGIYGPNSPPFYYKDKV